MDVNPLLLHELYQEEIYAIPGKTIVILQYPWHKLDNTSQTLITKILASVKLTPASVQILNAETVNERMVKSMSPKQLLIFGPQTASSLPLYEITSIYDIPAIIADLPGDLDDTKKKRLWLVLREMFGL